MGKIKKKPPVTQGKTVHVAPSDSGTTQTEKVRFGFRFFRNECISNCEKDEVAQAMKKLRTYSDMTWQQINQADRKGLGFEKMPRKQLTCPCDLSEDVEFVLSFRYSQTDRIIGLRDGSILEVLWFSHAHDAYPG